MSRFSTILVFILLVAQTAASQTDCPVVKIDLQGTSYTVKQCFPGEIIGKYLYEGTKEPIVFLGADGKGIFQKHGVSEQEIEFWIDCDENGTIRKKEFGGGAVQYTILVKYITNATAKFAVKEDTGTYDLFPVIVAPATNRVVILNERWKPLK